MDRKKALNPYGFDAWFGSTNLLAVFIVGVLSVLFGANFVLFRLFSV